MMMMRSVEVLTLILLSWIIFSVVKSSVRSGETSETCDAECDCDDERVSQYLSASSDFPERSRSKIVPGLHVGCVCEVGDSKVEFRFYKDGMRTSDPVTWKMDEGSSSKEFEKEARERLSISPDPGKYGNVHLRQAFRVFEPYTRNAIGTIDAFLRSRGTKMIGHEPVRSGIVYLIEGGQFVFPGVKVGSKQRVVLNDGSLVPSTTDMLHLETLSLQPLLFGVDRFLTDEESDHLIDLASRDKSMMKESSVVKMDHDIGKETKQWRTSSQMWLRDRDSPTLARLTRRVSDFTGTSKSHQEAVQMLRYYRDQFYSAHLDAFDPEWYQGKIDSIHHGHKNRLATLFWYISDVSRGGETLFPRAYGLGQPSDPWECEKSKGLKVSPKRGNIILWYNLLPNGVLDHNSLHSGCPVLEGTLSCTHHLVSILLFSYN